MKDKLPCADGGLRAKAVRRFCRLLTLQTDQMDCKFLISQLLPMSNIAESYLDLIPPPDWLQLLARVNENEHYIINIIEPETGPHRQENARPAYSQFVTTVIDRTKLLAKVG